MAFWKKGEDPWDIDPEKKRKETVSYFETEETSDQAEKPLEGFLTGLFKKKEQPAEEEVPMPCPYCGELMKKGYLKGGRDNVYWSETKPGFLSGLDEALLISDEGGLLTASYKTSYMCESCRKLVVDVPEPPETNLTWDYETPTPDTEQEEAKEE